MTLVARVRRWAASRFKRGAHSILTARTANGQYARQVMNMAIERKLAMLDSATLDAAEVSGENRSAVAWRSHTTMMYPSFDLLKPPPDPPNFDVVFCEQVLEHVTDPPAAIRTLYDITRPGGTVIVNTPFMIKFHPAPIDYWRFTPDALRQMLEEGGFEVEETGSWGNRTAVITNLFSWTRSYRILPKKNHPEFPVVVWAFGRRRDQIDASPSEDDGSRLDSL